MAALLELGHKHGSIMAVAKVWLARVDFDPSGGIMRRFGMEKVKTTSRNFNVGARPNIRLFAGIVRHRAPCIQEADQVPAMEAVQGAAAIEQIDVKT